MWQVQWEKNILQIVHSNSPKVASYSVLSFSWCFHRSSLSYMGVVLHSSSPLNPDIHPSWSSAYFSSFNNLLFPINSSYLSSSCLACTISAVDLSVFSLVLFSNPTSHIAKGFTWYTNLTMSHTYYFKITKG